MFCVDAETLLRKTSVLSLCQPYSIRINVAIYEKVEFKFAQVDIGEPYQWTCYNN